MSKRNPLEDEFYNSLLYKNLNDVGGKVAQGIGKAVEEVGKVIGSAASGAPPTGNFNRVNPPTPPQGPRQPSPPPTYNPPPKNGYTQNPTGNYRYVPPKQQAPKRAPPPPQWHTPPQNTAPNPFGVHPVPPPKPVKFKKKSYGGRRFLFTAASACLALTILPIVGGSVVLIPAAIVAGIGGYFLSRLIFKERVKKDIPPPAAQASTPKPAPKATPKGADTGNPELDKIIDEGHAYIEKLRRSNEAIPDEGISTSIDRMEKACQGIFDYVKDNPIKIPQIKKFLNYYLPTTLKLLGSYEKLSRQAVKGENISATMFDIEGMTQTIATAFEKQLDGLFGSEAMDIQADIAVFESILQQEGLKEDGQVQLK